MATRSFSRLLFPLSIIGVGLAMGCADSAPSGQTDAAVVTSAPLLLAAASVNLPAGVAPAQMPEPASTEVQLLTKYCTPCHGLSHPTTHSATDWPVVMRRMWLRSTHLGAEFDVPIPTAAERLAMLNYMQEHALKVSSVLPEGPGQDVFIATCGQCHDLPDPMQHSAEDWVAVVQRMSGRMETLLQQRLSQQDHARIVLYLESVSSGAE